MWSSPAFLGQTAEPGLKEDVNFIAREREKRKTISFRKQDCLDYARVFISVV